MDLAFPEYGRLRSVLMHGPGRCFILTMHPECIGRAARIRMLETLIDHMRGAEGTVFTTCAGLVEQLRSANRPHQRRDREKSGRRKGDAWGRI